MHTISGRTPFGRTTFGIGFWLFCSLWLGATAAFADSFERGRDAYLQGDARAAYSIWKPLAERGHAQAQARIGDLYRTGQGVEQDAAAAAEWLEKAAEQGVHAAQYLLGVLYSNGEGVPQDDVSAYMWLNLAVAGTDLAASVNASRARQRLLQRMTPEEIRTAERLAAERRPR